jgi:tubulin--tyrosine ligase-like protein 12
MAEAEKAEHLQNFIYYIPIEGNFSQAEFVVALLETAPCKLFIYPFNNDGEKMVKFYSHFQGVRIYGFNEYVIMKEIYSEEKNIVIVLTSLEGTAFEVAQRQICNIFREIFPSKIKDVINVTSPTLRLPFSLSLYLRKAGTEISKTIRQKYIPKTHQKGVLILPYVGDGSFLTNTQILETLSQLQRLYSKHVTFLVKLHSYCYFTNEGNSPHPLYGLASQEQIGVQFLTHNFRIVPEEEWYIPPFLDAFDIIITDLHSPNLLEIFWFCSIQNQKIILTFTHPNMTKDIISQVDTAVLSYVNIFSSTQQLQQIFYKIFPDNINYKNVTSNLIICGAEAKMYVEAMYGRLGDENPLLKVARQRHWNDNSPLTNPFPSVEEAFKMYEEKIGKALQDPKPLDFLARGLQIPQDVLDYHVFLNKHHQQLIAYNIPKPLWKVLYDKLKNEVFDSGEYFQFAMSEDDQSLFVIAKRPIAALSNIFLIDHAWTTTPENARKQLQDNPNLLPRMEQMMGIVQKDNAPESLQDRVERVYDVMWKYIQNYRVTGPSGDVISVWYVMDELGSRIGHSDQPSFRVVPFVYLDSPQVAYNLMWPIVDLQEDDEVTRDFAEGVTHSLKRKARLFPWRHSKEILEEFTSKLLEHRHRLNYLSLHPVVNRNKCRNSELVETSIRRPEKSTLKVFTNIDLVREYLTIKPFEHVFNIEEADILWFADDVIHYPQVKSTQMVNQFPNESCITHKHLLVKTIQDSYGYVPWFPVTYNLESELPEFIAEYKQRELKKENNIWIIKPWNFARGMEVRVTDNLNEIIRHAESGPKLVQKYIHQPVLYNKRKFDLRYILLVRTTQPLEVYLYKMFWIRLANKEFSLDSFDDYEKHFTVMNYTHYQMTQLHYVDFIASFEQQYPVMKWFTMQQKINEMIRQLMEAAVREPPPVGLGRTTNSGAIYGLDLMIGENFQPQLLECNFAPDCTRACKYDAQFYNVIFSVLFTNNWQANPVVTERIIKI